MTLPIHTVKHVKSSYRKIQIITICLTVLTLAAAFVAAISGIQLVNLEKQQSAEIVQKAPPPAVVDDALNKQIEDLKTELSKEKDASKKLKSRIADLNKQIASLKQTIHAPVQPVPTPEPSRKMQTPSSAAPATTAPKPVPAAVPIAQPTKTEPVAPKPGAPPVPEAPGKTADTPSTNAAGTPSPTIKPSVETTPPSPEKTPPAGQKPDRPSTAQSNTEPAQSTEPPAAAQAPPPASPDQQEGISTPKPSGSNTQ